MTDLMGWLYDHYIRPQIEHQPQDDGDELHFAVLESALMEAEKQDLEHVCRFYAVQGFRVGVKFGAALGEDLKGAACGRRVPLPMAAKEPKRHRGRLR